MKKILYLFGFICAAGLAACDDNHTDYVATTTLDIQDAVVDFYSIGGEGTITLTNGNNDIKVESNVDWCSIKGASERIISFTVLPNESMQTRTAIVNITTSQAKGQVVVTQSGFIANYDLSDFYSYTENKEFSKRIEFSSELPTSAKVDAKAAEWLRCEKTAGGFIVSAEANESGDARLGMVTLITGEISRTYSFLQYSMENLCKEWNASFLTVSGDKGVDIVSIQKANNKELTINIKESDYKGIKAYYENGAIKIPCGQYMKEQNDYSLYLGVLGKAGTPGITPSINFQMKPCLMKDGKWGLALADDGSLGEPISALATWAIEDGEIVGYWDLFNNLVLSY